MNPQPPATDPPTRRDDLAAVIRDACISRPSFGANDGDLFDAARIFISALEQDNIPHVLVGGLAVLQYVDGRNTRDIDLIIDEDDLDKLPDFTLEEKGDGVASGTSGPLRVNLYFTTNSLFALVSEGHSEMRSFFRNRLRCATPHGIILLKLFTLPLLYRQGNLDRAALHETDILLLLHHTPIPSETLLNTLTTHMPDSDINTLREVLDDIQTRLTRAKQF